MTKEKKCIALFIYFIRYRVILFTFLKIIPTSYKNMFVILVIYWKIHFCMFIYIIYIYLYLYYIIYIKSVYIIIYLLFNNYKFTLYLCKLFSYTYNMNDYWNEIHRCILILFSLDIYISSYCKFFNNEIFWQISRSFFFFVSVYPLKISRTY